MRRFNSCGQIPSMSMFDGFMMIYNGVFAPTLYIRISKAYRTLIESQFEYPYNPPHQFVFDETIQIGIAEIRVASNGELAGIIENLAIPSGVSQWEEVNA